MSSSPNPELYIVLIGEEGVGKSAATIQFVQSVFLFDYDPTIEDSYRAARKVDGQDFIVTVMDTATSFSSMKDEYYQEASSIVFMFSLTDKKSFDELEKAVLDCKQVRAKAEIQESKVPCVLVGTKTDVVEKSEGEESVRKVSTEEGREFARKINARCYLEVSNKNKEQVEHVFFEAVRSGSKILKEKRVQGRLECLRIQRFGGKENRISTLFREEFTPLRLTASFCGASLRAVNNVKENLALKKK